jgi:hypothetical protein
VDTALDRSTDPLLVEFLTIAYLAFRLGQTLMVAGRMQDWPAEAQRLDAKAKAYARKLGPLLTPGTPEAAESFSR